MNLTEDRLTCEGRCREAKRPFSVWRHGEKGEGGEVEEGVTATQSAATGLNIDSRWVAWFHANGAATFPLRGSQIRL